MKKTASENGNGASGAIRSLKDAYARGLTCRMFGNCPQIGEGIELSGNRNVSGTLLMLPDKRPEAKEPWRLAVPFTGRLDFSKAKVSYGKSKA